MADIIKWAQVSLAAIIIAQILLLVLRYPYKKKKREFFWFSSLLFLILLRTLLLYNNGITGAASFTLLWAGGGYLAEISNQKGCLIWHLAMFCLIIIYLLAAFLGFAGSMPFYALFIFLILLTSLYPIRLLYDYFKSTHSAVFIYFLMVAVFWLLGAGYDFLSPVMVFPHLEIALWISFLFIIGTGYLLAQEGYLRHYGWQTTYARMDLQEKRMKNTYSRLIHTENTLFLQDRLIASGFLAAGTAHEFKNVLSSLKVTAEHALASDEIMIKQRSLQVILEQLEMGRKEVSDFLDKLVQEGRGKPELVNLKEDLRYILGLVRATYRREGIRVINEINADLAVIIRKGELEQVLLNLIRNSVASLRKKEKKGSLLIRIKAAKSESEVSLDVIDNGSTITPELSAAIFKKNTGFGLYISRMLIERNGGYLEYIPLEEGSCFRIILPLS
ncbi:MAG TPA: HAMP domain-containing histidine kinase [Spirochaetales bacterium]|nr:HAMP domain-containing histidine kinase [Spirochaetales bacterium]